MKVSKKADIKEIQQIIFKYLSLYIKNKNIYLLDATCYGSHTFLGQFLKKIMFFNTVIELLHKKNIKPDLIKKLGKYK